MQLQSSTLAEPPDRAAARTTLLALAASLAANDSIDRHRAIILPKRSPVSMEDAVTALAELSKPIECTAESTAGILAVTCRAIIGTNEEFLLKNQRKSLEKGDGVIGSVLREHQTNRNSTTAIVLARDNILRVSLSALEYWWKNYLLTGPIMFGEREPTESERSDGAVSVIVISRSEDLYPHDGTAQK